MNYSGIEQAAFVDRPNRFIAHVQWNGQTETVHVKNTGRCAELLIPGARVYIQRSSNSARKTKWDLIAVEKGERLINMDSQIPNRVVQEWIEGGNLIKDLIFVRPETTYGNSRFDLYVEAENRKVFIEVKGVTLEQNGLCMFPDAPSDRAVKHLEELCAAVQDGYEAYVIFVIQMKGVEFFAPNRAMHPEFADALSRAADSGVNILAYDCNVTPESITINSPVDVVLGSPELKQSVPFLLEWYSRKKRDLPWRKKMNAYRVWVSEIMLQQTRVEAVIPYYERFMRELPDVETLSGVPEDRLLKLWEGLGYYNRARNLKLAACQIMDEYDGRFPETFDEISRLKGIGSYTAGAISSFVYHLPKPAVDGNVLRVVSRITADDSDIAKAATRKRMEKLIEEIIPRYAPGDFNQSLIELGAIVCVPSGRPKCGECPVSHVCRAHAAGAETDFPVKTKAKARRIEKRTVLLFRDAGKTVIRKRPDRGLLAGLYEFPNEEGWMKKSEALDYGKALGLHSVRIRSLGDARHIFSHVEWHMKGYEILVDELEREMQPPMDGLIFADIEELQEKYPIPSAFEAYVPGK